MAHHSYFFLLLLSVLGINIVQSEFVPLFTWGTEKLSEHVPALHRVSQESFKDILLEHLKKDPYIIVFAEQTLSPEDFAQRDSDGESPFVNIQQLKNQGNYVSYRPNVQNPIGALKQLNKPVTQMSIGSILSSVNVPKDNIWIINLDDAKDDETRHHMLKRHDSDMALIYQDALKKHENVLVIYSAYHSAWIAPDDVQHRNLRSLLSDEENGVAKQNVTFNDTAVLFYISDTGNITIGEQTVKIDGTASFSSNADNSTINATLVAKGTNVEFKFKKGDTNYWSLNTLTVNSAELIIKDIYAPVGWSYHCGALNATNAAKNVSLSLLGLQIQPFRKNFSKFGDAYDCVGFTSVPIWSGLFVTAIMLIIVTFGLTMMMDIKTMDRFDDPKGKTITVTASE